MHRYVSNNQKLCWSAVTAIETGNTVALASVMADAQQAFDNCAIENCPTQLTSPRLHAVMAHAPLKYVEQPVISQ
jgi:hypothetical protein